MTADKLKSWSTAELDRLRREYPDARTRDLAEAMGRTPQAVYCKAHALGIYKSAACLRSPYSGRLVVGSTLGALARFGQGHRPHNFGKEGWRAGGNSVNTQFRKGRIPWTWRPIGSERVTRDGYLQRKMTDTGCTKQDWRSMHVVLWEEHHGPIPPGHVVVFRNSNKADVRIENLEMLSKAENMKRNSVHRLPKALVDVCRVKGLLQKVINRRTRDEK